MISPFRFISSVLFNNNTDVDNVVSTCNKTNIMFSNDFASR